MLRQMPRLWADAGLKPHIVKGFKVSNDPMFEAKVTEIVGLYPAGPTSVMFRTDSLLLPSLR
jgi:hypothetical protein